MGPALLGRSPYLLVLCVGKILKASMQMSALEDWEETILEGVLEVELMEYPRSYR